MRYKFVRERSIVWSFTEAGCETRRCTRVRRQHHHYCYSHHRRTLVVLLVRYRSVSTERSPFLLSGSRFHALVLAAKRSQPSGFRKVAPGVKHSAPNMRFGRRIINTAGVC